MLTDNIVCDSDCFSEKILEKGFSIYEVIRVFEGHPIFLNDNLLRLSNSIKKSNIDMDVENLRIPEKLKNLIRLEHIEEGNIKYVLHFTGEDIHEYIYQIPHSYPTEEDYNQGVCTVSFRAIRENPEVKYINPVLREATNRLIREKNVYEIVLVDKEGYVTEGSRSNIFFIRNHTFYTAPTRYVLPGTCRKRIIDICKQHHLDLIEERVAYGELGNYEAAFISGTSPLVLPIRRLDDFCFNVHHPLLKQLMEIYFSLVENVF